MRNAYMNKLLLVLLSLLQATHAIADQTPLPGAAPTGQGNASPASGTGPGTIKFNLASIGLGSSCSSVVLEDVDSPDKAWVLPRVFIGVNRKRQKLFKIVAPVVEGDPWALRF